MKSIHRRFPLSAFLIFGLFLWSSATTVNAQSENSQEETDVASKARFEEFSQTLSGSKFVGNFTVVGQDMSKLTAEEYSIKSVKKMDKGDMWLFTARIKYGKRDMSVPIPLEVRWAGDDTPVITVTDFSIFGYGPFSARVVIYNGKYAGTWSHGDVHGHLFGVIKQGEAEEVDVEKYKQEVEAKKKESQKKDDGK